MSAGDTEAWRHLFGGGFQYYIAGRAAAMAQLSPTAANLLHHAVEMLLKGELSRTIPLEEIKKQYGHKLVKTWKGFKALHAAENLSHFDELVKELDKFEKIRYPDEIIKRGAFIGIGWGDATLKPAMQQRKGPKLPQYCLLVNEVDALVAAIVKLSNINPRALMPARTDEALRFLKHQNAELTALGFPPGPPAS